MRSTLWLCSKIGRNIIKIEKGTDLNIVDCIPSLSFPTCNRKVVVKGPLATLEMPLHPFVSIETKPDPNEKTLININVENASNKKQRAMWGTTRALLSRMVVGVQDGYTLPIKMVGVGYRALMENGKLSLKIGVAHPVLMVIPFGITVTIPAPQHIILQGSDWAKITQFAAHIRAWRKPEPYNQKGIFVGDETIKKKEGKKR